MKLYARFLQYIFIAQCISEQGMNEGIFYGGQTDFTG
jgi:hypothetical protein